jgi:rod shape-determining protein MreC
MYESKRSKVVFNIIMLIYSLYEISKTHFIYLETPVFHKFLIDSVSPLQERFLNTKSLFADFFDHYVFLVGADKENKFLRKKIQEMDMVIGYLKELKHENMRLKKLLQFSEDIPRKKVLAQIIGKDNSGHFRVLRINKGTSDGVRLKSTVITYTGLVGHVYRVADHYADILTILDPNNRVDVIVDRTRSHGILEGYTGYSCILKYVARTENIMVQDRVLTAGLGDIYPKGIHIGTIKKIEKESYGITQFIEVNPSVDFSKLEEVVVLVLPDEHERWRELQSFDQSHQDTAMKEKP